MNNSILLIIGYFCCISLSCSSQSGYSFPEDLMIDPHASVYGDLKVKRIEQYNVNRDNIGHDSINGIPKHYTLEYVIDYDSSQQISSFRHHFHRAPINIIIKTREDIRSIYERSPRGLYLFEAADTLLLYQHYTSTYIYGKYGGLDKIDWSASWRPERINGWARGVPKDYEVLEKFFHDDQGLLIRKEVYRDGQLWSKIIYEYKQTGSDPNWYAVNFILVKATETLGDYETFIEYEFYEE
ncbi:MAG: hypothetical protein QNK23_11285 [Crocinitomicaceae bacterium]|nr:hypothetical protein [Crocinitomicaceae bacterium]